MHRRLMTSSDIRVAPHCSGDVASQVARAAGAWATAGDRRCGKPSPVRALALGDLTRGKLATLTVRGRELTADECRGDTMSGLHAIHPVGLAGSIGAISPEKR